MAILSPSDLFALVRAAGAVPGADACAVAAAAAESGDDPDVPPGDNGQSWGLWQMDQAGGEGAGYTAAQLRDPAFAAKIMVPLFNRNYAAGQAQGLSGEALARYCCMWTERPWGFPDLRSPAADRYAAAWYGLSAPPAAPAGSEPSDPSEPSAAQHVAWLQGNLDAALRALGDVQTELDALTALLPGA